MNPLETLKNWWGYESFRPMQERIIGEALSGRDVLAIMPTGGGKSVCFQVPGMMREGISIVVTPLIALMKDQVQHLEDLGIKALAVHAGMTRQEIDLTLNNAAYGDFKFLYVSPERLSTRLFKSYLEVMKVAFIVVDEAHCISQWGYDFRPDYLSIGEIRKTVNAPVIALTATATPEVADDIMDRLGFAEPNVLRSGFERPNLSYIVRKCDDKNGQILSVCDSVPGSGIIYVRSRKKTSEIAQLLTAHGLSATFYHAGLGSSERSRKQQEWKSGKTRIMVSTNAFGMGIDKPDVRFVIHADLPDSPEAYFQEAGRAGRDGLPSYAVLLWNAIDVRRLKQIETLSFPSIEFIEDIYEKIHIFFEIPYEQGIGRQLKFNLDEFCSRYKLQQSSVFYAVRYIEREGHWTFSEDLDIRTRVQIIPDRRELYTLELPDPKMPALLEILMRRYTGLFSFPVSIDEDAVASALGTSVSDLRQVLYKLAVEHIIKYIPADRADVIYLHHDRLRPGNVALSPKRYERLRECYRRRMTTMLEFVEEAETCRSRFLLKYFGQEKTDDCLCCDICRDRRRSSSETAARLRSFIEAKGGSYTLEDIRSLFGAPSEGTFWTAVLRSLIDSGEVPPYHD
ncbi:MAG: RecQ family ATP-dependent DNA helicase [Bacteroidales bacterium]|nr:RecQ family ATP-dependent DNA helicase [Bacteroidales bacterium]